VVGGITHWRPEDLFLNKNGLSTVEEVKGG
jgi:hypothetical protein